MFIRSKLSRTQKGFAHVMPVLLGVVVIGTVIGVFTFVSRRQSANLGRDESGQTTDSGQFSKLPPQCNEVSSERPSWCSAVEQQAVTPSEAETTAPTNDSSSSSNSSSSQQNTTSSTPTTNQSQPTTNDSQPASSGSTVDTAWVVKPTQADCNKSAGFDVWAASNFKHVLTNGRYSTGTGVYGSTNQSNPDFTIPYQSAITTSGVKAWCVGDVSFDWVCVGKVRGCAGYSAYRISDLSTQAPPN